MLPTATAVRIKRLFNEAKRWSPSIVYIEDLDIIAGEERNPKSAKAYKQEASEDDDDVLDKPSLELRFFQEVLEVLAKSRVNMVVLWVKRGFSAAVSEGSGSEGSIRRIQVMDMAY
ncbi:hypothetical protein Tco_0750745 [Tanacetum coccineum]|uniref:ATPase AAA-type core domain-containing protein n=1 Tax=Tanacetum coccineum TaxID=301880 RepID=A0ABQ4Z231_9ASTR